MHRSLLILSCSALLGVGCGNSSGGGGGSPGTGGTDATPIEVTADSFECILDGTKVRKFYVQNLVGDLEESVAVANGDSPLPYPPGTVIQLFPLEAMVKREPGFSSETNDWEFFFLNTTPEGTEIVTRGKDETENSFGGNCFNCHVDAIDNDLICESDNGCVPLGVPDDLIEDLQNGDPRCPD